MGDPFRRVRPGDSFTLSAQMHNRTVDAVSPRADFTGQHLADIPMNFRVVVKNATTGDLGIYSCLYITGPVVNPTGTVGGQIASLPVLRGLVPDENTWHRFCITLGPVAEGEYIPAAVDGVTPVKLDVVEEYHRFAKPKDGDESEMETTDAGPASILWKESGTGSGKWGLIRIGGDDEWFRRGRISAPWNKGATAAVERLTEAGAVFSPTASFTAVNLFADVTVVSGQHSAVGCCRQGATWFLVAAECT